MKHLTFLLVAIMLGFTACSDKNDNSNNHDSVANITTATQTPTPPTIDPNTPSTYKSLTLSAEQTTLNKDNNTTLKLLATSSNGTSKELNTDIEYIITPNGSAEVNNNTLTLQAKTGNTLSNTLTLTVTWTVNGHTLPPEPDKALNDATLLGIDVNNNGVRDDVERKIYEKYPKKLHRELLLDGAKVFQEILNQPTEKAKDTQKGISRIIHCEVYLTDFDSEIKSDNWIENGEYIKDLTFNAKERVRKYLDYNLALSGGNFSSKPSDWNRSECSEAVRKVLTEMGK